MNYQDAINQVLKHEGGFVNNPLDRGGVTNLGITQKTYEKFKGRKVSLLEMKQMPKTDAIKIYKKEYWDKIGGDKIKLYSVAFAIFDQAVNRGPSKAIQQAQRIASILPNGKLGLDTINAINSIPESDFINRYVLESIDAYQKIVSNNPSQNTFLKGWINRANSIKEYSSNFYGQLNKATVSIVSVLAFIGIGFFLINYLNKSKRIA